MVVLTECEVAGCDRKRMAKFPLCKWHRHCQREGRDPHEVTTRQKYPKDATCKIDGCSDKAVVNWMCMKHDHQVRKPTKEVLLVDAPEFSKVCSKCRKVKPWQKFIRADITYDLCLECFRKAQKATDAKTKTYDINKALEEIRRLATGLDEGS